MRQGQRGKDMLVTSSFLRGEELRCREVWWCVWRSSRAGEGARDVGPGSQGPSVVCFRTVWVLRDIVTGRFSPLLGDWSYFTYLCDLAWSLVPGRFLVTI